MLAFLVSLAGRVNGQIAILFILVLTLSSPRPVQPTPSPVEQSGHPNPTAPSQAIDPTNPLLPLSSFRAVQHPPPRRARPIFCNIVALASLHRRVFLHSVGCQVAWRPLSASHHTFASFLSGWLSRQLIGFVHCPSFRCPAVEPSSRQAFAVEPSPSGRPANLGDKPSNHRSTRTPLPPIKPLIRPTPSSPRRPVDSSNPLLLVEIDRDLSRKYICLVL
jgi:hypothetical protein